MYSAIISLGFPCTGISQIAQLGLGCGHNLGWEMGFIPTLLKCLVMRGARVFL